MSTAGLNGNSNKKVTAVDTNAALLDVNKVPRVVGEGPRERMKKLYLYLTETNIPLYLIGDSGTGKTLTMQNLLKAYAKQYNVPAYYFQLSPEDTKTSVFIGLRLMDGSLVPFDGVMAKAARENAIVGIDEITHSTMQMLLMLNSIDASGNSVISIGDKSIDASGLKVIYGSNRVNHSGNIRVPPSFANRVIGVPFDYPSFNDEVVIAKATAATQYSGKSQLDIPDSVVRYLVSYMSTNRSSDWPLSTRNIAHAMIMMHLEPKKPDGTIDDYFTRGTNLESLRKTITERILQKQIVDISVMQKPEIQEFVRYVSRIGVPTFREIVKISTGFYIDIDGTELGAQSTRQKIMNGII